MKNIVVLVDLTKISDAAIAHASQMSLAAGAKITLLHIATAEKSNILEQLKKAVQESTRILAQKPKHLEVRVATGDFFTLIKSELQSLQPDLVSIGTHALPGRDGHLYAEKIVQLLAQIEAPKLIVQGQRDLRIEPMDQWLVAGGDDSFLTSVDWIQQALSAEIMHASQHENIEALETEALDEHATLIVWTGDLDAGKDLLFNSFGIPVLIK